MKKKFKKLLVSLISASFFGLATVFGWLIVQGTLSVFPKLAGVTAIIIGVVGLGLLGYFGFKTLK